MVIATQNPIEYEGTYPLPEAQLDRFMFKVLVSYASIEEEMEVLRRFHAGFDPHELVVAGLKAVVPSTAIAQARTVIQSTLVEDGILEYIARIARE